MEWYEDWARHKAVVGNSQLLQLLAHDMHKVGTIDSLFRRRGWLPPKKSLRI